MLTSSVVCVLTTLLLVQAEVPVNPVKWGWQKDECVDESATYQTTYHAPPRSIPSQQADPKIRRGFLELFRRQYSPSHSHGSNQDPDTLESMCLQNSINQTDVDRINDLLGKNDTLSSFSDRNLEAVDLLHRIFMDAGTPENLLQLAREQLHRHTFNQKVWYNALIKTLLSRPDLNGTIVAWPVDATPDLYITESILRRAREGALRPEKVHVVTHCMTAGKQFYTEVRHRTSFSDQHQSGQIRNKRNWGNIEMPTGGYGGYESGGGYGGGGYDDLIPESANCSKLRNPNDIGGDPDKQSNYINLPVVESTEKWSKGWDYHLSEPWHDRQNYHTIHAAERQGIGSNDNYMKLEKEKECIPYSGTTGATGEENRLWYFREDMMLNQHHWYWHQYHPKIGQNTRDRRGEIFFFAHHNIIARYNAERLSNGLPIESPLELRENATIGPGYFSDLIDENTGRFWTLRLENTPLSDIIQKGDKNFGFNMKISDVAKALETLVSHVKQGYLLVNRTDEEPFPLNIKNEEGLGHLGNTVEEYPRYSPNRELYQNIHSLGHLAISVATDPDFRCKLLKGVMSDVSVAMRDPAFFKVHTLVDTIYRDHKRTLPPYQLHGGEWPLQWGGVKLKSLEVIGKSGQNTNFVRTHWSIKRFPLEEGIDGSIHEGEVKVNICHKHLNHEPFVFKLIVDVDSCAKTVSNKGTVRIFMAPRFNLDGRRFTMEESRHLMFQLDVFPVELSRGRNTITRNSWDSSATKPWTRTLTEMLADPDNGGEAEYCGCGWPRHLYIPKGSPQGMEFDLFAMVTSFDDDQVLEPPENLEIPEPCNSPYLYCGRPYKRYPDSKPMGYPFDRVPYFVFDYHRPHIIGGYGEPVKVWRVVHDLEDYVAHVSNMQSSVLRIQHMDTVIN